MPKSVDVEDFAAKLALLVKRLNWSRTKVAQQVGVDKSLAARWLNGRSRPTANSLMQLTTAVAPLVDGFTAADWDLPPEQFAQRLGIVHSPAPRPTGPATAATADRLRLTGLRNPPQASTWGAAYVGLWAGFYHSLTNRGLVRLMATTFAIEDGDLRFGITDGFFVSEATAIATHSHVHCVGEVMPLDNHLIFLTFNGASDMQGAAVIDGLVCIFGADHTPSATPIILFRVDDEAGDPVLDIAAAKERIAEANRRVEADAARGDPLAGMRAIATEDVLAALSPVVGAPRPDGQTDYVMRIPPRRSLVVGRRAMEELPPDASVKVVRGNLRRVLGLSGDGA